MKPIHGLPNNRGYWGKNETDSLINMGEMDSDTGYGALIFKYMDENLKVFSQYTLKTPCKQLITGLNISHRRILKYLNVESCQVFKLKLK